MRVYPCLTAPPKPNTVIKFRLVDASKALLSNFPSSLKPSARAGLLAQYPGGLRIHIPMIFCFGVKLGYNGPPTFIFSDNLASVLEDPAIIEKKLQEDLALGRVIQVPEPPTPPFISSLLSLVPKHDGGWRKIHHLLYP